MSQEQLAARLTAATYDMSILAGWVVSRDVIAKWETGVKLVTDEHLRLLTSALSVDARWLIGDPAGHPPKKVR